MDDFHCGPRLDAAPVWRCLREGSVPDEVFGSLVARALLFEDLAWRVAAVNELLLAQIHLTNLALELLGDPAVTLLLSQLVRREFEVGRDDCFCPVGSVLLLAGRLCQ